MGQNDEKKPLPDDDKLSEDVKKHHRSRPADQKQPNKSGQFKEQDQGESWRHKRDSAPRPKEEKEDRRKKE